MIILWSTVYTTLGAAAAYGIFHAFGFGWDHLVRAMDDEAYRANNALILIAELITAVVAAMALVLLVHGIRLKIHRKNRINQQSAWFSALSFDPPEGAVAIVQVNLKSGRSYCGDLVSYDPDLGYTGREITLEQPLFEVEADGSYRPMHTGWQRLMFVSDEIASVAVQYTWKELELEQRPALQWHASPTDEDEQVPAGTSPAL